MTEIKLAKLNFEEYQKNVNDYLYINMTEIELAKYIAMATAIAESEWKDERLIQHVEKQQPRDPEVG